MQIISPTTIFFIYKKMKKFYLISFACIFFAGIKLFAVPAIPTPIEVTQPDGTTLTIRLIGDESFHYTTTLDGFLIVKNQEDAFVYATVSQNGELQPTERIAHNESQRSAADQRFLQTLNTDENISRLQKSANTQRMQMPPSQTGGTTPQSRATAYIGEQHMLVILVNFTDKSFVYTQNNFVNLTNQTGYNYNGSNGCVREYFMSSSNGKFKPTFDVVGPYTLSNNMAYYGQDSGGTGNDIRPAYMIQEACTLANPDVDFSKYDYNNDGQIDNVVVVYAGLNQAEGGPANTIWPHRWAVQPGYNITPSTINVTFDGKKLFWYSCVSELRGASGTTMANIGTFTHEFSHVVGLPDYYNTSTGSSMVGYWSVMDQGNYANQSRTPPLFNSYDRFYVGWLTPEQYVSGYKTIYPLTQDTTLITCNTEQAYLVAATTSNLSGGYNSTAPSPSEFFMIEYREATGWDAYLGSSNGTTAGKSGLLIWHIDYNATTWANNQPNVAGTSQTASNHMKIYLHPTNGTTSTTQGGAFTTGSSFTPKLWNGTDIQRPITDITKNCSINMTFGGTPQPTPPTVRTKPATAVTATTATLNKTVTTCSETATEQGFKYKKTSETVWQTSTTGSLTGLSPNTEYQFYAYAVTASFPMTYCETLTFKTLCLNYNIPDNVSVCSGTNYKCPDGTTLSNITAATSHTNNLKSIYGCDSIVVTNISVKPTYNVSENKSVCSGGSYTFPDNTTVTNITAPTSHTSNLTSVVYGCDSIVVTNISVTSADLTVTDTQGIITANQAGATYQWYIGCDNVSTMTAIEGATEQTYQPTQSGYYSVMITYKGCEFMSDCIQETITSIEQMRISIFPNPVKNILQITNLQNTDAQYEILDLTGKQTANGNLLKNQSIDVSALPRGVYILKIGELRAKFIKE